MGFSSGFAATYGAMKGGQVADAQVGRLNAETDIKTEELGTQQRTGASFQAIGNLIDAYGSGASSDDIQKMITQWTGKFTPVGGSSVSPNRPGQGFWVSAGKTLGTNKGKQMSNTERMSKSKAQDPGGTSGEGYGATAEDAGIGAGEDPYALNGPDAGGADAAASGLGGGEGMDFGGMYESSKRLKERRHNAVKNLGAMY